MIDGDAMWDMAKRAQTRQSLCEKIARHARHEGIDATWQRVNRNLPLWERWYTGALATGHLLKQTGARKIPPGERDS
jgi:hypothetical protein